MKTGLSIIIVHLVTTAFGLLCAYLLLLSIMNSYQPSSRVLVTAAHLGEVPGYTCIYSDEETDVGVYLKDNYVASKPPISSRVVYGNTHIGVIKEVYDNEFRMSPLNHESIVPGVSGTPVYYKRTPIGYISGWDGTGLVRCIFY